MSTAMLFDPMIKWPSVPTVSDKVQYFIDDGIILYGGTKGPFKLKGSMAVRDTTSLLNKLRKNKLEYLQFIEELYKESNFNNLVYVLTKLHSNGCLSDLQSVTPEERYLGLLNQNVKNYNNVNEVLDLKSRIKLKLNVENTFILDKLHTLFSKDNFNLVQGSNYDWQLFEVSENSDISLIDETKQTLLFSIIDDGYILGPIVSKNAFKIKELESYFKRSFSTKVKPSTIYDVYLTTLKTVLKLSDLYLDRGLLEYNNYEPNYIDKVGIIGENKLSIIDKYEITSAFSSPKYQNKSNHMAHFREGNVRLGKKEFLSDFWKKTEYTAPRGLEETFLTLAGFNKSRIGKKITPTGGNINSNLLFYVNLYSSDLEGIGLYYFDNVTEKMYKIDDDLSGFQWLIRSGDRNGNGYIILASNVEFIEEKYHDFAFKIANLNTGVQLATLLSVKKPKSVKGFNIVERFEEKSIKESIGASMSKLIINAVLEVIKDD